MKRETFSIADREFIAVEQKRASNSRNPSFDGFMTDNPAYSSVASSSVNGHMVESPAYQSFQPTGSNDVMTDNPAYEAMHAAPGRDPGTVNASYNRTEPNHQYSVLSATPGQQTASQGYLALSQDRAASTHIASSQSGAYNQLQKPERSPSYAQVLPSGYQQPLTVPPQSGYVEALPPGAQNGYIALGANETAYSLPSQPGNYDVPAQSPPPVYLGIGDGKEAYTQVSLVPQIYNANANAAPSEPY